MMGQKRALTILFAGCLVHRYAGSSRKEATLKFMVHAWFLIRGEETVLQNLDREWVNIENSTSWKLERCYQPAPVSATINLVGEGDNGYISCHLLWPLSPSPTKLIVAETRELVGSNVQASMTLSFQCSPIPDQGSAELSPHPL